MSNTLADYLRSRVPPACSDSIKWAKTQPDAATAWAACTQGGWMLWFAARTGVNRRQLVRAACACARLSLVHVPAGEDRPRIAIETAEAWARGEASVAKVRAAADGAFAAAADGDYAAAYAAAGRGAAGQAARAAVLSQCADLCRKMLPMPEVLS